MLLTYRRGSLSKWRTETLIKTFNVKCYTCSSGLATLNRRSTTNAAKKISKKWDWVARRFHEVGQRGNTLTTHPKIRFSKLSLFKQFSWVMFLHLWCPVWSFLGGCSTPEEWWSGWWSGESSWPGGGWRRRRGGREPAPESWKSGFKLPRLPYNAQNLKLTRQPKKAHSDQVFTALLVCVHWSLCSEHLLFLKSESCLWMFCYPCLTWPFGRSGSDCFEDVFKKDCFWCPK